MVKAQKMDIPFFLFSETINHENWPFIDKTLHHFDLQINSLGNRQTEIWQKSLHVPQKGVFMVQN